MYDALTTRYTFACPERGESRVRLSSFRLLERLPGTGASRGLPGRLRLPLREEHPGLVSDQDLDWAPLGFSDERYLNLMTARFEEASEELSDLAVRRILAGEWPWSFYCFPESRPRPVFPSSFVLLAPGDGSIGLAVRCPACEHVSVNLVSPEHVDLPFHNDLRIGVVPHVLEGDAERIVEEFQEELDSARFDARRLDLD